MDLNIQQQRAITARLAEIICIAGPGSGKTRVLTERIRHLIASGTKPAKIVAITFTVAAAREIETRIKASNPTADLGYLGTLHGFILRLLNQHNQATGFPPFTVLDGQAAEDLLAECMTAADYKGTAKELKSILRTGPGEHLKAKNLTKAELVAVHYFRHMRQNYVIDFDRILHFGLELLRLNKVRINYDHLLVDEVQDSGDLDIAIYKSLSIPQKFFVGDPRQSIYKFRGANVRHIQKLKEDARENYSEVIHLSANYRCAAEICRAANSLLLESPIRYGEETRSATGNAGAVYVHHFKDETQEARAIAKVILDTPQEKWNEIAILVRTNSDVQRWEKQLGIFSLPARVPKPKTLPHDWSITRLFLSLMMNPENNATAQRFIELTKGDVIAKKLASEAKLKMTTLNKLYLHLPRTMTLPEALGILEPRVSTESRSYIHAIAGTLTAGATLAELILAINQEENKEEEEGVGIMITTIHKAKGREWDHVFLPGWNDEFFPKMREDQDVEEERRIAFVAITRARHKLELSYCDTRTRTFGPPLENCKPSRFIQEAGLC